MTAVDWVALGLVCCVLIGLVLHRTRECAQLRDEDDYR